MKQWEEGGRMKKAGILRCMKRWLRRLIVTIVGAFYRPGGRFCWGKTRRFRCWHSHLDVKNNRQTTSLLWPAIRPNKMGSRVSDKDTFTITRLNDQQSGWDCFKLLSHHLTHLLNDQWQLVFFGMDSYIWKLAGRSTKENWYYLDPDNMALWRTVL